MAGAKPGHDEKSARRSCAAGGCAIEKVLLAPFRPGAPHVVILWPVFSGRSTKGRTKERHHGPDGTANKADQEGDSHRERSDRSVRTTQSLLRRSSRIPRSSSSRCR